VAAHATSTTQANSAAAGCLQCRSLKGTMLVPSPRCTSCGLHCSRADSQLASACINVVYAWSVAPLLRYIRVAHPVTMHGPCKMLVAAACTCKHHAEWIHACLYTGHVHYTSLPQYVFPGSGLSCTMVMSCPTQCGSMPLAVNRAAAQRQAGPAARHTCQGMWHRGCLLTGPTTDTRGALMAS
jgi:hypothetical protein